MKIFWRVFFQTQIITAVIYSMAALSFDVIFGQKIPFFILPLLMSILFFMTIFAFGFYKIFDWIEKKLDKKS